ncbi:MAG: bifunctional riboflavin kinase/FAD synthetase [Deferrisomatales bacterium]
MSPELEHLRRGAREFARSLPEPAFYRDCRAEAARSAGLLGSSPVLEACREALRSAAENLGHGVEHAEAVARDAGILVQLEAGRQGLPARERDELVLAVQVAALWHDLRRGAPDHARAGAAEAERRLGVLALPPEHKPRIVAAIGNHEAFQPPAEPADEPGRILSDCLYDADKFRWGPDNFTHTLWDMVGAEGGPGLGAVYRRFLQGLDTIRRIRSTFRSEAGRRYGPEFIDQGMAVGRVVFRELGRLRGGHRMELVTDLAQLTGEPTRPAVVTLGNFDGVHLGHQRLVHLVLAKARELGGVAAVLTFHPHPLKLLAPERCPPLLSTYDEKVARFQDLGIDLLLMVPFTPELARLSARAFAEQVLRGKLGAREVVVGRNYRFGAGREGTVEGLRALGRELGFAVTEVREVTAGGEVVSSTKLRHLVQAGDVEHAARLLGRPYAIAGRVVAGDRRGRELGFPTANVAPYHELMPYPGVYAVHAEVGGELHPAVVNAGFRPTFDKREFSLEAHLLDASPDLYGREITLHFVQKIRDERRFESLPELVAQIGHDCARARELLGAPLPAR